MSNERNMEVATTIMKQMGGQRRLALMTGANTFIARPEQEGGLSFKIKSRGTNFVKVLLRADDTYDVEFGRVWGTTYKVKATYQGVYADMLVSLFEKETGMYLSL